MFRVVALQLRAETTGPVCGVDLLFQNGLNVLRADNSSGKSTCLQALLYALGLEGMLSPRREIPLPHAMTDSIEISGRQHDVLRSYVRLEFENGRGDVATVERAVKGITPSNGLVKVLSGRGLTRPDIPADRRDYFVRRPGAAQREAGFHRWLAEFLGWELPKVTRTDGTEGPLYIECLFPYFFVEQKHGWLGLQARIPTYFGIRDVVRRSAEFVLGLDAYAIVLKRQRLESEAVEIEAEWKRRVEQVQRGAEAASVVPRGLTVRPPIDPTDIRIDLLLVDSEKWLDLDEAISRLRAQIAELVSLPQRTVVEDREALESSLDDSQAELTVITAALTEALGSLDEARARTTGLNARLAALEDDLQRHKDAIVLRTLGSRNAPLFEAESHCPTCYQFLPDGFDVTDNPMSEEQNITFIEQEVRSFRAMHRDSVRLTEAQQVRVQSMRQAATATRSRIREVKDTLVAPSSMPSPAAIAERFRREAQLHLLEKLRTEMSDVEEALQRISNRWAINRRQLADLGRDRLSATDKGKIDALGVNFRRQIEVYGFRSLNPSSIRISEETYRPTHDGFDLGFDLSASDMIRSIWAYLLSLAELGRDASTNHLGFLALDEPRQQEVAYADFSSFMRRLADVSGKSLQVLVATSEEAYKISEMLSGKQYHAIDVPSREKLLKPVSESYREW